MFSEPLTYEDALSLLAMPDDRLPDLLEHAYALRTKYKGRVVSVQLLTNAKSGDCTQNCAYCAQSGRAEANIRRHGLVSRDVLLRDAEAVRANALARHCIGLSGLRFTDEEIGRFAASVRALKAQTPTPICCSIGFLTEPQAILLRQAGVDRINHNLNTGRRHYPHICSTHTYEERVANIRNLQRLGFEICSGGIIGLGETHEDIADMLFALQDLQPQSVPINFFIPIEGTALARADVSHLTPAYCLRVLCLARLLLPRADIRCAAGREIYLKGYEKQVFMVADSIFAGGYLTSGGQGLEETKQAIADAGFSCAME